MQVSEVLVADIETAEPDTPIRELAHRMRELAIGFIPIVEGDRLVGVITDRDIVLRGVSEAKDSETARARDLMSLEVVCCFQDESVEQARQLMAEHNVRRLPVIDRHHHLVGIIKLADIEGQGKPVKKAVKVTFHKDMTDSSGHPHKVTIKTVYITGAKDKEAAQAAAVKQWEEEKGGTWSRSWTASKRRKSRTARRRPSRQSNSNLRRHRRRAYSAGSRGRRLERFTPPRRPAPARSADLRPPLSARIAMVAKVPASANSQMATANLESRRRSHLG